MKKIILIGFSIGIFFVILFGIFTYSYYLQDEKVLACRILGGKLHRDENLDIGFFQNEIRICKYYDQTPGKLSGIGYCTTGCNGSLFPSKEKREYDLRATTRALNKMFGESQEFTPN